MTTHSNLPSESMRLSYIFTKTSKIYKLQTAKQNSKANGFSTATYLIKVNNRNTRTICEICSNLPIKTPGRSQLLTLKKFNTFSCVTTADFEQVNAGWVEKKKIFRQYFQR